jgi:hypothetical protein
MGGSTAGAEKKRAASPRPVGRSKRQHRSSSQNNKTAAAASKQEQPTEEKKKKKKLTWREKGAPGCSRCRYNGCGTCYVAVTPTVVAPEVVEPGGSPSVVLVALRTKDHDDEKKPPVAAAASPTRRTKDAIAPTAAMASADASSTEDIERRLLRIGRAASRDYSRLLSLRSFPAVSADGGGGHGLFLDGEQTELGLLLELKTWVDQKMCSVCHARMGMYVVLHDVAQFPRFYSHRPLAHAHAHTHTRRRVLLLDFFLSTIQDLQSQQQQYQHHVIGGRERCDDHVARADDDNGSPNPLLPLRRRPSRPRRPAVAGSRRRRTV